MLQVIINLFRRIEISEFYLISNIGSKPKPHGKSAFAVKQPLIVKPQEDELQKLSIKDYRRILERKREEYLCKINLFTNKFANKSLNLSKKLDSI